MLNCSIQYFIHLFIHSDHFVKVVLEDVWGPNPITVTTTVTTNLQAETFGLVSG